MVELSKIIEQIVIKVANEIEAEGVKAILPGHNGPYYDIETNIRNMAHWCVTFSEYYIHTKSIKYLEYVRVLADEILNSSTYSQKGVYKCREPKEKDEMNGVIGPAWIIEGLIYASKVTGDDKYYNRAKTIFDIIPFNHKLGLWNRINLEGNVLSIDSTFNHQLWLAAAGSIIHKYRFDSNILEKIDRFIERLPKNMTIRKNGRIGHFTLNDKHGPFNGMIFLLKNIKSDYAEKRNKASMAYKENGYHLFNLYGFAILYENYGKDIPFLKTDQFQLSLKYIKTDEYMQSLNSINRVKDVTKVKSKLNCSINVYGYPYNSPAFEICRVATDFLKGDKKITGIINELAKQQIEFTFDKTEAMFSRNTDDIIVLTARIYEYIVGNEKYWTDKKELR